MMDERKYLYRYLAAYRGGAVPDPTPRGGSKWRGKFSEGSDYLSGRPSIV